MRICFDFLRDNYADFRSKQFFYGVIPLSVQGKAGKKSVPLFLSADIDNINMRAGHVEKACLQIDTARPKLPPIVARSWPPFVV